MYMRLREFTTTHVSTGAGATQAGNYSKWAQYGPGVLQAAEEFAKGRPTKGAITALKTALPAVGISPQVQAGLDVAADLELLSTIVRNPTALATFLATFSKDVGAGEDAELKRQQARMAQMGPLPTQK
jgi:hypothetical protein